MFLHTFVKATRKNTLGWCAPVEMEDDVSQYVSYVIPLNQDDEMESVYSCEVVKILGQERILHSQSIVRVSQDSLMLELPQGFKHWFTVRPISKSERRLPYLGCLEHEDFSHKFTEIEPEDIRELDRLCHDEGLFIIGCDPFQHYVGLPEREALHRYSKHS